MTKRLDGSAIKVSESNQPVKQASRNASKSQDDLQKRHSETRLKVLDVAPPSASGVSGAQRVRSQDPCPSRSNLWLLDLWLREVNRPHTVVTTQDSAIVRASVSSSDDSPEGTSVHNTRRAGGARREASTRVNLRRFGPDGPTGEPITGWSLNISRGGVRVVVEEIFEQGEEVHVTLDDTDATTEHHARVAWVRDEADGQIIGVQFLDVEGTIPPPEESNPAAS